MAFKVRNLANNGWYDLATTPMKIRNAANSAWINLDPSNLKVRDPTNVYWQTVSNIPTIVTTSGFTTIMDLSPNPAHDMLTGGIAYGLWPDGPIAPWRGNDGVARFTVCSSENYNFRVPDWNNGASWLLDHVYDSPRLALEGQYANRAWLFGKYAIGANVYCLAHHEWYVTMKTVDGIPGFNGYALANRRWVNGIKWHKSTDNGLTWATKGTFSSADMVIAPEPWGVQSRDTLYGFFHPTNIVKEGSYYYCFVDHRDLPGGTNLLNCGTILIRTLNLELALGGWEYWNGTGWTTIPAAGYIGGLSGFHPHKFDEVFAKNPYTQDPGCMFIQSLRYHVPSGMWLAFGSKGDLATRLCFMASATLANPQFDANGVQAISLAGGGVNTDYEGYAGRYTSVFDPSSPDVNYQTIVGSTATVWVSHDYDKYKKQTISIT